MNMRFVSTYFYNLLQQYKERIYNYKNLIYEKRKNRAVRFCDVEETDIDQLLDNLIEKIEDIDMSYVEFDMPPRDYTIEDKFDWQ